MGVPVITLAGQGMAGRLTSSILAGANCEEWIAADHSTYVDLARRLAEAGPRHQTEREQLRKRIQTSALERRASFVPRTGADLPRGLPVQGHRMKTDKCLLEMAHQIGGIASG